MKKTILITTICITMLLVVAACYFAPSKKITGDKNTVKKSEAVESFQSIELEGSIDNCKLYFTQDSTEPAIRIEIDSNILDKMAVFVKDNILTIKAKEQYHNFHLFPSVCNIYCNAATLTNVKITGSGDVICQTALKGERLHIDIIGSGDFIAKQSSAIAYLNSNITGSGDIVFFGNGQTAELKVTGSGDINLNGNYNNITGKVTGSGNIKYDGMAQTAIMKLSGSGDLDLGGQMDKLNIDIAGSSDVEALTCDIKNLDAHISGSGTISATVTESISAQINGSGSLQYKGNPTINSKVSGSGVIEKIEK